MSDTSWLFEEVARSFSTEGIEAVVECNVQGWHIVGRVRADVDRSFGEPGAEVFRHRLCSACLGKGRSFQSVCYVEGAGHTCSGDGCRCGCECMCASKDVGPCGACGGRGYFASGG